MVFEEELKKFTATEQQAINDRLMILSQFQRTGAVVRSNLSRESFLPGDCARDILQAIAGCDANGPAIRAVFEPACHRHAQRGIPIRGSRPQLLGRAVPVQRFCLHLKDLGLFGTQDDAHTWLRIVNRRPMNQIKVKMRHIPLTKYLVWATYYVKDRAANPFDYLPSHPDQLQDALGLPVAQRGQDLLLFVYRIPPAVALLFPTVSDAGWNDIFLPAPADSLEAGWTLPTLDHPDIHPQPEVVHHPISCESLEVPLRWFSADPNYSI